MSARAASTFETAWLSACLATRLGLRDRSVVLLAGLFIAMVLVSAYLGWSATATVNAIYAKAVPVIEAQGLTVPANPVGDTPPLSLLRNMVTYVALLGALAALVLGHQVVAADRKAGVVPLLFSRAVSRAGLAFGKMAAVAFAIAAILLAAGLVNVLTLLVLPGLGFDGAIWLGVLGFYCVSALYMLAFGLLGAICAAALSTESMALLIPVTIWLAFTFIVPQLTANIGPMAALNPQSASIVPPTSPFFTATSALLGPFSIAESYRYLASSILGILPGAGAATTAAGSLLSLMMTNLAFAVVFAITFTRLDACRSEYHD